MRSLLVIALALAGLTLSGGVASAQYGSYPVPNYGPGYRGNISPYLNLFRGQNTGIDYYLGTRSEFQRRNDARQFREDLTDLRARDRVLEEDLPRPPGPVPSGTYALSNNTGGYFNNTYNYFGGAAGRPQAPVNRPGMPPTPARRAGSAPRSGGTSPGFSPNPFPAR